MRESTPIKQSHTGRSVRLLGSRHHGAGKRLKRPDQSRVLDALQVQVARQSYCIGLICQIIDVIRRSSHVPFHGLLQLILDANTGEDGLEPSRQVLAPEPVIQLRTLGFVTQLDRSLTTLQVRKCAGRKGEGGSIRMDR